MRSKSVHIISFHTAHLMQIRVSRC